MPGSGPLAPAGLEMKSVISWPSVAVQLSVCFWTPVTSAAPVCSAENRPSKPSSAAWQNASSSSRGDAVVNGTGAACASRPNAARAARSRGSVRGSVPRELAGSPRRPGAVVMGDAFRQDKDVPELRPDLATATVEETTILGSGDTEIG